MRVAHYFEMERFITGGIRESVRQQRAMLDRRGITYDTGVNLDADLLHLNVVGPRSIAAAWRANRRDVPVIIHTHVTAEDFRDSLRFSNLIARPLRPYLARAYGMADRLICPSAYTAGVIDEYTDVERCVISNGVDVDKFQGFEDLRESYLERFDLEPPVVFMVGHVFKRKGLATFVETARAMPDLDFAWFGPLDRHLKDGETKRLIDSAPPNCTFTGFVDDVRGAYAAGDIFFFPTHEENEGMTLLEAMATERAILVRDIETFEWLEDGTHCLKAEEDFANQLERLREPSLRQELGEAAGSMAERFTLGEVSKQLEACYQDVLEQVD